jgi:hypothetical protein
MEDPDHETGLSLLRRGLQIQRGSKRLWVGEIRVSIPPGDDAHAVHAVADSAGGDSPARDDSPAAVDPPAGGGCPDGCHGVHVEKLTPALCDSFVRGLLKMRIEQLERARPVSFPGSP